jgi:hypothetical protein
MLNFTLQAPMVHQQIVHQRSLSNCITRASYFSKIHTEFQGSVLNGTSVTPTSEFCMTIIFVLMILQRQGDLKLHDVYTKFLENPLRVSEVITGDIRTDGHNDYHKPILPYKIRKVDQEDCAECNI